MEFHEIFVRDRHVRGERWAVEEDEHLRKLFSQHKKITEIASELKREVDAVVCRLIKIGVIGYCDREIPERHGFSWAPEEIERLKKEYSEGTSIDQIAKLHKRQRNAILYKLVLMHAFDITDRSKLETVKGKYPSQLTTKLEQTYNDLGGDLMEAENENRGTKIVEERPSVGGTISGRNDAIFLKNKYQAELEVAWDAIRNIVNSLEQKNTEIKALGSKIPAIKKNIEAHLKEREDLYTNLGNLLNKETKFEEGMWKTTLKGRKVKSITLKQKFTDSDVESHYDSMLEYLKQYPEYASKSTFKKITDKIEQKEAEIREAKEKFNEVVSDYNHKLSNFEKDIKRAEDKFKVYNDLKKEATDKLKNARYNKSALNKLRSEQAKAETNLDLLHHRVEQFENTLSIIKSEHSEISRKKLKEAEF